VWQKLKQTPRKNETKPRKNESLEAKSAVVSEQFPPNQLKTKMFL
jgi:hypothetical protein